MNFDLSCKTITVKIFLKPKDEEAVLEEVKKGFVCKVRGEALLDTFSREIVIMGRDISKLQKIEKMDTSQEKRVELHLHTQMSSLDAVVSASDIVKRAAKWGHKAVAITDHGVAQAYPEGIPAECCGSLPLRCRHHPPKTYTAQASAFRGNPPFPRSW